MGKRGPKKGSPGHPSPNRGKGYGYQFLRKHMDYAEEACLTWPLFRDPETGYGMFGHNGRSYHAHRFMCEMVNGPAPSQRHQAAHSCGKGHEGCVHPRHLSWKTNTENQADRHIHGTAGRHGRRYRLTEDQVKEIRNYSGRETIKDIAIRYGVTRSAIRQILQGKVYPNGKMRHRTFSGDEVLAIKKARGIETLQELAARYGVSPSAIWRIQAGRSYA